MLRGIPDILSPELLKIIAEMGHGDTLVIGDANFPATSIAKARGNINIRCDGHKATELLDAILQLMPIDTFVEKPIQIMDKCAFNKHLETPVWDKFIEIASKYDERGEDMIEYVERFDFYERAKDAYAVVSTTEHAFYACIIITKGVL